MNFLKKIKKKPFIYLNHDETSQLLDQNFKKLGPVSMQFLWMDMIKSFLEKNKPIVSVPYKGMLLIISQGGEYMHSTEFKEIVQESLGLKEGKDKLINLFMGDVKENPILANRPETISDEFPSWLDNEFKGEYLFSIMLNTNKVFEHVKQILDKHEIKYKTNYETFYSNGFRITYDDNKTLDIYEIIKKWILSGLTLDALEGVVLFAMKGDVKISSKLSVMMNKF